MGKLTFQAALGGTVDLVGPNTASAVVLNLPAVSGDIVGTGSAGVITTGMISGQIAVAQGGTNSSTAQGAINTLAGAVTSGSYLRGNGTNVTMSAIQAADVPTLNQNTTGTAANITASSNSSLTTLSALSLPGSQVSGNISGNAANVTGIVAVANGGTGTTTPALVAGTNVTITGTWPNQTINSTGGGSGMIYPGAGIAKSTGSAWDTSYSTTGSGNVVLNSQPSLAFPKIDSIQASTSTGITTILGFTNNAGTANGPYLNVTNATPSSNNPIVLSVTNAGVFVPNLELQAAPNAGAYVVVNNGVTPSIQMKFNPAGTASTYTILQSSQTTNRTLTLPDATDTLVGKATTDTLTNKTINGSNNTITNVSLTSSVTGTLPVANGGTNQTSYTDGQLLIGNSTGNTLAKATLTAGSGISITNGAGSITIAATNSGTVTSVTGTSPVVSSGGTTPAISLATAYGDTLNPYASKTANYVLAAPNGTAGVPSFRAIVATDIPTLNQNTTGTAANITATSNSTLTTLSSLSLPGSQVSGNISGNAANVTGTVAIANGGSGTTTAQGGMNAFAGAVTAGSYLRGNGANVVMSTIQAADVPTLNQNTTGTAANITGTSNSTITTLSSLSLPGSQVSGNISGNAANVTGTVAIGNGGTGQTTASAAFNALSPVTTAGDLILGNGTNSSTRLPIGANGYVLTSDGTTASWAAGGGGGGSGTVTSVAQSFTGGIISVAGSPVTTSGTLALTVAGTSGGIPYFSSGTTWASSAAGTAGQVLTSNGAAAPTWSTVGGLGTVTSVDVSGGTTGLTTSGGPITTTGTITLAGTLATSNGGIGTTNGSLANCTVDGTNAVGYLNVPQNAQTGAYTLVLADGGKHIYHASGAAAATYTIPAATSVAYPIGTVISFVNLSANNVTIAITTDTMYLVGYGSTGSRTLSQYGVATATKVSGTSSAGIWIISGVGLT